MEAIKQLLEEIPLFNLGWASFAAKSLYMMVYLGVTWQLINVATDKIKKKKKKTINSEE